ncbi:MAG: hypothetical protein JWP87_2683 [Labilithrix sp.]|nr:hypothetical protein [Labilithrix sp.]
MNRSRRIPVLASLVTLAAFAVVAQETTALAADAAAPRASSIIGEAERWLTAAAAGPTVASDPTAHGAANEGASTAERTDRDVAERSAIEARPVIDFSSPHLALVARDWRGSMQIVGDRTMLVDDLRPTASNRMVVARLHTDARISTFAQVGAGEWRIDTAMFPNARSYSEVAGQVGGGFELHLPSNLRVAGEASYTALYRDLHYTSDEVAPRILAFVVAIDGRF